MLTAKYVQYKAVEEMVNDDDFTNKEIDRTCLSYHQDIQQNIFYSQNNEFWYQEILFPFQEEWVLKKFFDFWFIDYIWFLQER